MLGDKNMTTGPTTSSECGMILNLEWSPETRLQAEGCCPGRGTRGRCVATLAPYGDWRNTSGR